jgi:hypothetical protein
MNTIAEFISQLSVMRESAVVFGAGLDGDDAVRTVRTCFGAAELVDTRGNYSEVGFDALAERLTNHPEGCVVVHTRGRPGVRLSRQLRRWASQSRKRVLPPCVLVCSGIAKSSDLGDGIVDSFPLSFGVA